MVRALKIGSLKTLKVTMFESFSDFNFQEIDTEQVLKVLSAFNAVAIKAVKNSCMREILYILFRARIRFVALINKVPASTDCSQLRSSRFCPYVGYCCTIRS